MNSSFLLQREQWIPRPIQEVFAYFAAAHNLEALTPPWLGFRILSPMPIVMRAGTRIQYRIRWHGWPVRWLTEIRRWDPLSSFVDVQLQGPYRLWHHTHSFASVKGGTLMRAVVHYALPFGFLGQMMHGWLVQVDLQAIFDYRARKVEELWGAP
jgi:ligand-binding SRPBCC domain-containing protein